MKTRPRVAVDLFCGLGGWAHGLIAAGWQVHGFDIVDFSAHYPGEFHCCDILAEVAFPNEVGLVVASPPCEQFSRHGMPWTRKRNPPPPDLSLVAASYAIAAKIGAPVVVENVRAAQQFIGRSVANCGPFHLWGDVPAIVPVYCGRSKESRSGKDRSKRAVVPFELAYWVGRCF